MGSPYLDRPLRAQVLTQEMYLVVKDNDGTLYFPENDCGLSKGDIVRGLSSGQWDWKTEGGWYDTPLAIVRFSFMDNEAEIVTEKIADAVLAYRLENDNRNPCPFLDEHKPDWRIRSGLHEEAA